MKCMYSRSVLYFFDLLALCLSVIITRYFYSVLELHDVSEESITLLTRLTFTEQHLLL